MRSDALMYLEGVLPQHGGGQPRWFECLMKRGRIWDKNEGDDH